MNTEDYIRVNVPLLIRLLEWAHEDCKSDVEIHDLVQNAIKLSLENDSLEMEDYDALLGKLQEDFGRSTDGLNIDHKNNTLTINLPYNETITFNTKNHYYFLNGKSSNYKMQTRAMMATVLDLLRNPSNPQERINTLTKLVQNNF